MTFPKSKPTCFRALFFSLRRAQTPHLARTAPCWVRVPALAAHKQGKADPWERIVTPSGSDQMYSFTRPVTHSMGSAGWISEKKELVCVY